MDIFNYLCGMLYTDFHFKTGNIKKVGGEFKTIDSMIEYDMISKSANGQYISFELFLRNKLLKFDVVYDINISCEWHHSHGESRIVNIDTDISNIEILADDNDIKIDDEKIIKNLISSYI